MACVDGGNKGPIKVALTDIQTDQWMFSPEMSTHLLLLLFFVAPFLPCVEVGAALLLLVLGVLAILGTLVGRAGGSSSDMATGGARLLRCFSGFFFFFLSFLSRFFLGLTIGPCESAANCSCTALS